MSGSIQHQLGSGESFSVATFNLENYLDASASKGRVKSAESKAKLREIIRAINPDVLVVQEMGSLDIFGELRASLAIEGLDFLHWEYVSGADTDLHIAILSRFPFAARIPHVEDHFNLNGLSFRVRRGFAEVEIQVNKKFSFTLIAAHLKSKNGNAEVHADRWRLEEAKLLRGIIGARLEAPEAKVLVAGDFNDTEDSEVMKTVVGHNGGQLIDARPAERNGDLSCANRSPAWTNYFEERSLYERIDFVLMSKAMADFWMPEASFVLGSPDWRIASDHRPVVALFHFDAALHPSAH